jgi:hypothetical protein
VQVLQRLEFRTKQDLATMETRWDIANHPVAPEAFEVRQTEKFCQGQIRSDFACKQGIGFLGKEILKTMICQTPPIPSSCSDDQ